MPKYLLIAVTIISCKHDSSKVFEIAQINDSTAVKLVPGEKNRLVCTVRDSISSTWLLEYPVYQFQSGDIDGNGTIDLAVGVIKATRYDSTKRKRLFLYQVRNKAIIPLWLGTSVGHPIIDFRMIQHPNNQYLIRIIGEEKSSKYLVAEYEWYGFGLSLNHYVKREIPFDLAKELLYTHV